MAMANYSLDCYMVHAAVNFHYSNVKVTKVTGDGEK